jgi:hypothetical protein
VVTPAAPVFVIEDGPRQPGSGLVSGRTMIGFIVTVVRGEVRRLSRHLGRD